MTAPDVTAGDALELQSQLYALLGDRSSNPDGDSWPHWSLRRLVRDVLALPELRALIAERDEARATVEEQKALIARNHRAYLSVQGIDTSDLNGPAS